MCLLTQLVIALPQLCVGLIIHHPSHHLISELKWGMVISSDFRHWGRVIASYPGWSRCVLKGCNGTHIQFLIVASYNWYCPRLPTLKIPKGSWQTMHGSRLATAQLAVPALLQKLSTVDNDHLGGRRVFCILKRVLLVSGNPHQVVKPCQGCRGLWLLCVWFGFGFMASHAAGVADRSGASK